MREPSPLPGWTRGHVLTHIARNADGLGNLLRWARTGTEIPMYASAEARSKDVEAGAGRPAADLAADVRESAAAFAAEAANMPGDAWTAQVRALYGQPFPAFEVLDRRLAEVEIHHVDLAAGYSPADWPAAFVAGPCPGSPSRSPGATMRRAAWSWRMAPRTVPDRPGAGGRPPVSIHGQPADLLAWLLGRADGTGLTLASGDTLPELPRR